MIFLDCKRQICLEYKVLRNSGKHSLGLWTRVKKMAYPAIAAAAVFTIYPSITSYQDIASLASNGEQTSIVERWLAHIPQVEGVTKASTAIFADASTGVDKTVTGSIKVEETTEKKPRLNPARITTGIKTTKTPQSVNRSGKGGRVVSATVKQPPKKFSAGSVLERHSMLEPLNAGKEIELAFVKAKPVKEAFQVAATFHPKKKKVDPLKVKSDLPVMVASLVKASRSNLLAYSPEPKLKRSPFAAILEDESAPISIIPKLNKRDHKWAKAPLPKNSFGKKQQHCLAAGIYFEARGEPVKGQAAVSQVILNRVRNPSYPNSICGVVYQNKHWRNRCQFSFACDRIKDRINDKRRWDIAKHVARETTHGRIWLKQVGSSTHYHATYVNPKWAKTMKRVGKIGLHIFYRTYGGGWS